MAPQDKTGWRAWAPHEKPGTWIVGLYFFIAPVIYSLFENLIGPCGGIVGGIVVSMTAVAWFFFEFGKEQALLNKQQSDHKREDQTHSEHGSANVVKHSEA